MSSGARITLVVVAALLGLLAAYYGLFSGGDESAAEGTGGPLPATSQQVRAVPAPPGGAAAPLTRRLPKAERALSPNATDWENPDRQANAANPRQPATQRLPQGSLTAATQRATGPTGDGRVVDPLAGSEPPGAGSSYPVSGPPIHLEQPATGSIPVSRSSGGIPSEPFAADRTVEVRPARVPVIQPQQQTVYIIKSGDTFWTIAEQWFGDASKWNLIAKANPLVDPNRIRAGMKINLPPRDATLATVVPPPPATRVSSDGPASYTVKSGDTLSTIAQTVCGETAKWYAIYESNRNVIGPDPDALQVGMKLTIPASIRRTASVTP